MSHPVIDTVVSFAAQDARSAAMGERANCCSLVVGMRVCSGCFAFSVAPHLGVDLQWQCVLCDSVSLGVGVQQGSGIQQGGVPPAVPG